MFVYLSVYLYIKISQTAETMAVVYPLKLFIGSDGLSIYIAPLPPEKIRGYLIRFYLKLKFNPPPLVYLNMTQETFLLTYPIVVELDKIIVYILSE